MKILCVILGLPQHLKYETIRSVMNQTIPVDMIVLLTRKSDITNEMERTPSLLNEGYSHIKLEDFDYILRLDGDTILKPTFVKRNLEGNPDLRGAGYAHLIKVKPFLKLMKGKYHPQCEDAYLNAKFKQYGMKVGKLVEEPLPSGLHPFNARWFVDRGRMMYLLGWAPFHVVAFALRDKGRTWYKYMFTVGSYFLSFLAKPAKFDVAEFIWNYQIRSEISYLTRLVKRF
jgi:hypothetical protein